MANPEHLEILKKGVEAWNEWRRKFRGKRPDLRGADLIDADLIDADLRRADLRRADLINADLRGADLSGADLSGADLSGADLSGANLSDAILIDAILVTARLIRARFDGAEIDSAALGTADLTPEQRKSLIVIDEDPPTNVRPKISLTYEGGIKPEEIFTLQHLVNKLQKLGEGAVLRVESITPMDSGAEVVIEVLDLGGATIEQLREDAEKLKSAQRKLASKDKRIDELEQEIKDTWFADRRKPGAVGEGERELHTLVLDAVGFSKMETGGSRRFLDYLRAITTTIVETCGGQLINMEGDSVIAVFSDSNDALLCAIVLARHLNAEAIETRGGIASGRVRVTRNRSTGMMDVDGDSVNLAARLQAGAGENEILVCRDFRYDEALDGQALNVEFKHRPDVVLLKDAEAECHQVLVNGNSYSVVSRLAEPKDAE